jgi:hypothetical protein
MRHVSGKTISLGSMGVLLAAFTAVSPVLAADDAVCLPRNRIYSIRAFDSKTVLVFDRFQKQYTMHLRGNCVGLDRFSENLSLKTRTEYGCVQPGETLSYNRPNEGTPVRARNPLQTTCFIDRVTEGAPPQAPKLSER